MEQSPELPELLALVAEGPGLAAALTLVTQLGGQRIYVEKSPREQHRLARLLGLELAQFLSKHYGGEFIEVPTGRSLTGPAVARRMAVARAAGTDGKSNNALAAELKVTRRWIIQLRRNLKQAGGMTGNGQGDLFVKEREGEAVHPEKSRRARP